MIVSLDFETYSACDLRDAGAWVYAEHSSTEPICLAYAIDDADPVLWTPDQGDPLDLFALAAQGAEFHAWNSFFEWCIWHRCCRWPAIPVAQWHDTAARAAMANLPRALGDCGAALGLPEYAQKSKRGRFLISRLCVPYRGVRVDDVVMLGELHEYCRQDVVAERAIAERLPPLPDTERAVWELDQAINIRGVGVDLPRVDDALAILERVDAQFGAELWDVSGGELADTRSSARVREFLAARGVDLDAIDKATVADALDAGVEDPAARRVLEIRQATGKSSTAKYQSLRDCTGSDARAHGLLRYHGAATGRWAGALFQPQNLPRPTIADPAQAIAAFPERDPDWLAALFGCPMQTLASCIRGMLVPAPGHRFIVADYSAIEPRVLAWVCGQSDVLDVFQDGGDLYRHAAAKLYRVPLDQVDAEQRFVGKVATLALGYAGGAVALSGMARNYGVELDAERAEQIKTDWREANPEVVRFWRSVDNAAIVCVRSSTGQVVRGIPARLEFAIRRDWLTLRLPSGRHLWYYEPRLVRRDEHRDGRFAEATYDNVEYSGVDTYTRQWTRTRTYGGKLVENIVQAIARDVMAAAMLRVEAAGYRVVLTVHDEIVVEVVDGFGSVDEFVRLLCEVPPWAAGLPVAAVGAEMARYGK